VPSIFGPASSMLWERPDARFEAHYGPKPDVAPSSKRADRVAKIPKCVTNRATIADRCSLHAITEVARGFVAG
jgi:hypothetical protein